MHFVEQQRAAIEQDIFIHHRRKPKTMMRAECNRDPVSFVLHFSHFRFCRERKEGVLHRVSVAFNRNGVENICNEKVGVRMPYRKKWLFHGVPLALWDFAISETTK